MKTLIIIGLSVVAVIILSYMLFRKKLTKEHRPGTVATAKMNRNMKIVLVLVVGLLLGYIVYPFINPSGQPAQKPTISIGESKTTPQEGWKTFEDKASGISFEYPNEWKINNQSQVFEQGDLVDVRKLGETQKEETEFYDGGRFTVMKPLPTYDDMQTWLKNRTSADDQVSDVRINEVAFKKVYTCGLGCFTYYYTIKNGKAYGINTFAEGSKKVEYQRAIDQMLNSLVLPK